MGMWELLELKKKFDQEQKKTGALVMRLQTDLDKYRNSLVNPRPGQIINIEIREKTIEQFHLFMSLSAYFHEQLTQRIYELQNENDVPTLKSRIKHLESRLKKAEMVLSRGYNYDLSLLNFQSANDF